MVRDFIEGANSNTDRTSVIFIEIRKTKAVLNIG
jgi:hypothetical protein